MTHYNYLALTQTIKEALNFKVNIKNKDEISFAIDIAHQQINNNQPLNDHDLTSYLKYLILNQKITQHITTSHLPQITATKENQKEQLYVPVIINASHITPKPIDWIWPNYLAKKKLHILGGAPGTGKTTLALSIAAIISNAEPFPDGQPCQQHGNILIWSAEDGIDDTLLPRLQALNACTDHIHIIYGRKNRLTDDIEPFNPAQDIHLLHHSLSQIGKIDLIILDPVISMIKGDMNKATDVRQSLQPLLELAETTHCAILGITHFTKGTQGANPLERVIGSISFGALARIVWVTAKGKQQTEPSLLAIAKSNIGKDNIGINYHVNQVILKNNIHTSTIEWGEPILENALQQLTQREQITDTPKNNEATDTLKRLLQDQKLPSKEIKQYMHDNGFTEKQIRRAREGLDILIIQEGFGKELKTYWQLPLNSQ